MEFKVKSTEELAKMSAEELAAYFNQKNEHERGQIEALISEKSEANAEELRKLQEEFRETQSKQMDALNQALKRQGSALQLIIEGRKSDVTPLTTPAQIKKALEANFEKLKSLKNGGSAEASRAGFDFEIKAPGVITSSNIIGGNVPVEDRIEGLNIIPSRRVRLLDIMSQRATESNLVSWVYQANKDGTAGVTGENAAKNQIDFDLVVAEESVKKVTAYIKVTTEMLDDISWIQSQIQAELMRELLKAVEAQVYSGDGTGNNLNGVRTVATAFAAGTFANTVDNANLVDVLTVAKNQILIAEHDMPNFILMHPSDVTSLMLEKVSTTDKRYEERMAQVGSTMLLDGIPIIPTTLVTVDEYLIGNFDLAVLVNKGSIKIDIGLDADDFTNNRRTILAEWRGLSLVMNNNRTAFIAGDFSTDAAALETP